MAEKREIGIANQSLIVRHESHDLQDSAANLSH